MFKFKIELLYNEEKLFCTETELLSFNFTLPLAKLNIVSSRLVLNGLTFLDDIPVCIQLVIFYCYLILGKSTL